MANYFDDLIRDGRDADAMRLFAQEYYDNGKMGHTRKLLCERVADENDRLRADLEQATAQAAALREAAINVLSVKYCQITYEDQRNIMALERTLSSDAGAALLEETRALRMIVDILDKHDLAYFDLCPEWCCCYEENPCSFQLEWMARRKIQGREAADKWASSACESGTSEMEGDHEAE